MRPAIITASYSGSTTNSQPVILDKIRNPFNVGFGCVVSSGGTITFSVQHTFDDLTTVASPTWFNHSVVNGQSASVFNSYAFPIAAVRLQVTAGTNPGSVTATFIQAGPEGR